MTVAQLALLAASALVPQLAMFWLHATDKSRSSLGARTGALESRLDYQDGYRAGHAAGRVEALAERGRDGK